MDMNDIQKILKEAKELVEPERRDVERVFKKETKELITDRIGGNEILDIHINDDISKYGDIEVDFSDGIYFEVLDASGDLRNVPVTKFSTIYHDDLLDIEPKNGMIKEKLEIMKDVVKKNKDMLKKINIKLDISDFELKNGSEIKISFILKPLAVIYDVKKDLLVYKKLEVVDWEL